MADPRLVAGIAPDYYLSGYIVQPYRSNGWHPGVSLARPRQRDKAEHLRQCCCRCLLLSRPWGNRGCG